MVTSRIFLIINLLVPLFFQSKLYCQKSVTKSPFFIINGKVQGLKDSSILFLSYDPDGKDSAFIVNNEFHFQGKLKKTVTKALIRTKNYSDFKFFWLENSTITFTANRGNFPSAEISGSTTQTEDDFLKNKILPFESKIDSLRILLSNDSPSLAIKTRLKNNIDSLLKQVLKRVDAFIKTHPNSMVGLNYLQSYYPYWGKKIVSHLYSYLSKTMKETREGKEIFEYISVSKEIKQGDSITDFIQYDTSGKQVRLSDFKGKVILLNFWASWCMPCRKENILLAQLYAEYKNKEFEIFGVTTDTDRKAWKNAIKHDNMSWINVSELNMEKNIPSLIYSIYKYPTNFLIDRNGIIRKIDVQDQELINELALLLK